MIDVDHAAKLRAMQAAAMSLRRSVPETYDVFYKALEAYTSALICGTILSYNGPTRNLWAQKGGAVALHKLAQTISPSELAKLP